MTANIIEQFRRFEEAGLKYQESTKELIEAARKIEPAVNTREEALALAEKIIRDGGL